MSTAQQITLPAIEVADYVMVATDTQFTRPFLAVVLRVDHTENQISVRAFDSNRRWDTVWFKGDPRIEARAQLFGDGEDHAVFDLSPKGKVFNAVKDRLAVVERAMQVLTGKITTLEMELKHASSLTK